MVTSVPMPQIQSQTAPWAHSEAPLSERISNVQSLLNIGTSRATLTIGGEWAVWMLRVNGEMASQP